MTPSTTVECTQTIEQAAAAAPKAAPAPAPPKVLPPTGGVDTASLLGLGVGALLVAGGLLVKIIR